MCMWFKAGLAYARKKRVQNRVGGLCTSFLNDIMINSDKKKEMLTPEQFSRVLNTPAFSFPAHSTHANPKTV